MARKRRESGGGLTARDLEGQRVTIEYTDGDGDRTTRPVRIIRYYDDRKPTLYCHCGLRNEARSFLVERIDAMIDGDGVVETAEAFLSRFGIRPNIPAVTEGLAQAAGTTGGFTKLATAEAEIRQVREATSRRGIRFWFALCLATIVVPVAAAGDLKALFGFLLIVSFALMPIALFIPRIIAPDIGPLKAGAIAAIICFSVLILGFSVT